MIKTWILVIVAVFLLLILAGGVVLWRHQVAYEEEMNWRRREDQAGPDNKWRVHTYGREKARELEKSAPMLPGLYVPKDYKARIDGPGRSGCMGDAGKQKGPRISGPLAC